MIAAVYYLAIFCCFSLWLLKFWWENRRFYELASRITQVDGHLPFMGHAYKFIGADSKGTMI